MSAGPGPGLTFYPYGSHMLEGVLKPICSEHGGIVQSLLMSPAKYSESLALKSVVAQMPAYHKVLLSPELVMQYHLSGHGIYYEEALIRLAGEAIERYALLVAPYTLADRMRYGCYREMTKLGRVVPMEYLQAFSEEDYVKLNRGRYPGYRRLQPEDVIGWVSCPSLFAPDREIWVPAQMVFVGYRVSPEHGEVAFCPGFSTGTAAHTDLARALQSALLESVEIDALMLHWYTSLSAPSLVLDDPTLAALLPGLLAADSRFEVVALDLSVLEGVEAHVFASVLVNRRKERPYIVLGAQASLEPVQGMYRSLTEAVAVAFLGTYGPIYVPEMYLGADADTTFTDLDHNVAFFASPDGAEAKRDVISKLVRGRRVLSGLPSYHSGDAGADTARLLRQLSSVSEYGVYLDVTPPETRRLGWRVMRVLLPELVTMCLPGVPYHAHPRFEAYGGVCNEYPHPLP